MVRLLIVLVHTGFAGLLSASGLWLLAQGRLNAAWESGFYRAVSPGSLVMTSGSLVVLLLAALQALFSIGYLGRQRWGAIGVITFSALHAVAFPPPISWLFWAILIAVALELWNTLPRRADPEE